MPASAGPPSLVLKNLTWVALGLPSMIVHATTEPDLGVASGLWAVLTLTWKPVVRLTARQGVPGQLGTVAGVVAGIRPISVSVAGATAGRAMASAKLARTAGNIRFIWAIEHRGAADVAV